MADLILLVDDEPNILRALVRLLARRGFETITAASGAEALELLAAGHTPKVVVTDYRMPRMDGVELLSQVRQRVPAVQRVLLTGQADVKAVELAINEAGVDRFLSKPWEEVQLLAVLRSAVRQHDLHQEKEALDRVASDRLTELQALNASLEAKVNERTELLARTKRIWEHTFDVLADPVAVVSVDRVVDRANAAFARVRSTDVRSVPNRPCWERIGGNTGPCSGCTLDAAVAGRPVPPVEMTFPTGDRYQHSAQAIVDPRTGEGAVVCVMRDVTRERDTAARVLRDEKLVAVERMAASIAHQINNPLAVMLANLQFVSRDRSIDADLGEALQDVEEGVRRCQEIVRTLTDLTRRPEAGGAVEAGVVDETAGQVAAALGERWGAREVHIKTNLGAPARRVVLSNAELDLVIRTLLEHACEATSSGGEVALQTAAEDGRVQISVRDAGEALSSVEQEQLFEPYYRPQSSRARAGVGMATAYALVRDRGGDVRVRCAVGAGNELIVTLPAVGDAGTERRIA